MAEKVDDIHFNMPKEDVILLKYALADYRGLFKEDCKTGRRLDNIIKILDLATDKTFLAAKKEEQ